MEFLNTQFLICGGGTSAVCAALQAARLGLDVLMVEEGPWLGGMLTAAGVSAVDGNYCLQGGIWKEFREALCLLYGGDEALKTGWVSQTLFQPRDGEKILRTMVEDAGVHYRLGCSLVRVKVRKRRIEYVEFADPQGKSFRVKADTYMEGTEYGELIRLSGIPCRFGMEARGETGEPPAPLEPMRCAQDITYAATLRYGPYHNPPPQGYDPEEFAGLLESAGGTVTSRQMMDYGRLPGDRFMLNWPRGGNDYHLPEKAYRDRGFRKARLQEAKGVTLRLLHFINTELKEGPFVLDTQQYPTEDGLPPLPYIREAFRIRGEAFLCLQDLEDPYEEAQKPYYLQSIAVGDYPVDHHRLKHPDPMDLGFPSIPSFGIPYGCLVTRDLENLLAGEKSISVSSLVNGTTRLQPVAMGLGQAAGAAAWLAWKKSCFPWQIPVRELQIGLLDAGAYILPYKDVSPGSPWFETAQYAGVCGRMRGWGRPSSWANETHFFPHKAADRETAFFLWGDKGSFPADAAGWLKGLSREYGVPVPGIRALSDRLDHLIARREFSGRWIGRLPALLRETASWNTETCSVTRGELSSLVTALDIIKITQPKEDS